MLTFGAASEKKQYLVTHESANGPCGRKCQHSLSEVPCCFVTGKWEGMCLWQRGFLVCQKELVSEARETSSCNDQGTSPEESIPKAATLKFKA